MHVRGFKKLGLLLTLPLLTAGCAIKLVGSPADRPAVIARMCVTSDNPGNRTTVAVKRTLKEHDINLSKNAPVVLVLSKMTYDHPFPDQINAGVAFTTTATMQATYEITTTSGKTIIPENTLSVDQSLFHNANQVNTTSMDDVYYRTLSRKLANNLYYKLSSTRVTHKIEQALGVKHAVKRH